MFLISALIQFLHSQAGNNFRGAGIIELSGGRDETRSCLRFWSIESLSHAPNELLVLSHTAHLHDSLIL